LSQREVVSMKVTDLSVDELRTLIKGAIKEEVAELLEVKRRIFELETLQALKEVEGGKVKAYDMVEEMLKDIDKDEI
jgi:predicted RecB family endonuclease